MISITGYPWSMGRRMYNELLALSIVEAAPVEPVDVDEVKDHLHISFTDDDTWIEKEITACRQSLEKFTGLSFVPKTITANISNAAGYYELPYGPVVSITSFKDSEDTVLAPADYVLHGIDFKTIVSPTLDLIKIVYIVGYANAAAVPAELKGEIKRMVAWNYEKRGDNGNDYKFSNTARSYRRISVIL